jgi:hypothetical protein
MRSGRRWPKRGATLGELLRGCVNLVPVAVVLADKAAGLVVGDAVFLGKLVDLVTVAARHMLAIRAAPLAASFRHHRIPREPERMLAAFVRN